jgi:formiminoglutamase
MDIVCLDPTKDVAGSSVKASVHTMLSFLSGFAIRKGKPQEAASE